MFSNAGSKYSVVVVQGGLLLGMPGTETVMRPHISYCSVQSQLPI